MKHKKYSAVVIGSGIAGLYAAIKLQKEKDLENGILVITKTQLIESNSKYAQGGMVCVIPENELDSCTLHVEDTLIAGAGLTDKKVAEYISSKGAAVVKELQNIGVDFDRDENNQLKFTKEAAHSVNRILHAGGDATGFCIENALVKHLMSLKNVDIYEQTLAVEILKNSNNVCKGLITYNYSEKEYEIIEAPAVILATGGIGQLYKHTTNPDITTGDGIALAYRAGAIVKDMEFVQFHPTAFSLGKTGTMFLISEAVRGEGAKLVHKDGSTFMEKYDKRLELAPRDIVTRAIFNEMREKGVNNVYLDTSHIKEAKFAKRFPTIYATCLEYGITPTKDLIPVSPSAHYFMGGIKTEVNGKTSIEGLYAIGEAACTGLHGANRLASNSILECAVTAYELVEYLKTIDLTNDFIADEKLSRKISFYEEDIVNKEFQEIDEAIKNLKQLMWKNVGIIRNKFRLKEAEEELEKLLKEFNSPYKCQTRTHYEYRNMLTIAQLVVEFALNRKESRGAHFREDYPQKDLKTKSHQKTIQTIMKG